MLVMRHARQDLATTVSDVFVRVDTVAINVKRVRKSERVFEIMIIFSYYSLLCKVKYSITIKCRVHEHTYSRYL